MQNKSSPKYEDGLLVIQKGIQGKGAKQRDKVQQRLSRLAEKYPGIALYSVDFEYDEKE